MDGGKYWLEAILKRRAYDESPLKILEMEEIGTGLGKGENYLSVMHKFRAKILLGSGKVKTMSFMVKCEHETEFMKKVSADGGVFRREIVMYRDVLPKMQELLETINDLEGVFWAKCYDIRLYNRLVFEDLGESGYKVGNRFEQLSLNAALMALKVFAKFHALSRVLLDRGEIPTDVIGPNAWTAKPEGRALTKEMVQGNLKTITRKMECWGEEWEEAIERLKAADLPQKYLESFDLKSDEFIVVCHGDSWTNNMMFRGDDLHNPTSIRLIDLQMCMLNTPGKDIAHFLLTSVRLEDRKQHIDLLLGTYADTLNTYLTKLGYKGNIPTVEDLKAMLEKKAVITLCDCFGFIPIILAEKADAPDFEDAIKKYSEAKEKGLDEDFGLEAPLTQYAIDIIKYEITVAMEQGVI